MGRAEQGDLTEAIAALESLLANARPVPLTDQVRLRPGALRDAVARVEQEGRSAGLGFDAYDCLDELERIAAEAKPIPLTREVRVDPRLIRSLLDRLRPHPDPQG